MIRFLFIPLIFLLLSSQSYGADCGQFKVVKGDVKFQKKGRKRFRKARINKKICQGDKVKTEADSRAKIVMADQNEINISPQTELLIEIYEKDKKAVLNVLNGKVRSNVKRKYKDDEDNHYRVKTKSAVAGVRGTEFLASFSRATNESKIVTFEGIVKVGRLQGRRIVGSVLVKPGHYTSNRVGKNPHPAREIPIQELSQMDQETNLLDTPRDVSSDGAGETIDGNEEVTPENGDDSGNKKPKQRQPDSIEPDNDGNLESGDSRAKRDRQANTRKPDSMPNKLPPPDLSMNGPEQGPIDMPTAPSMMMPPPPPMMDDTICQNCKDPLMNQKVNLTIVPRLPGQ